MAACDWVRAVDAAMGADKKGFVRSVSDLMLGPTSEETDLPRTARARMRAWSPSPMALQAVVCLSALASMEGRLLELPGC